MTVTQSRMFVSAVKTFVAAGLAELAILLSTDMPITWKALLIPVLAAGIKALLKRADIWAQDKWEG